VGREVVIDTETTGLEPAQGHRIVEIGCVELSHHVPTGRNLQLYVNPERDMPEEAFRVHGLSDEFLRSKPLFADIIEAFDAFIEDDPVVIHNASFDLKFLNAELGRLDRAKIPPERAIDTLAIARKKYPGAPASLDALCKRFQIDSTARTVHGALLDAELLAHVYLELIGGRPPGLTFDGAAATEGFNVEFEARRSRPASLPTRLTPEDLAAHKAFLEGLPADALWLKARSD
jgi:DNA polymerase-3 subunit epsilon